MEAFLNLFFSPSERQFDLYQELLIINICVCVGVCVWSLLAHVTLTSSVNFLYVPELPARLFSEETLIRCEAFMVRRFQTTTPSPLVS